jgi:hypothetical protein
MPADEADNEIARLHARVAELESRVRSLLLANLELQDVLRKAVQR